MHTQSYNFDVPPVYSDNMAAAVMSAGVTEIPSSKRKLKSESEERALDESQEGTKQKRSRGRPRLDTRDETAADRRRTQIRLAQRAYRHRKDTAITTLEDRVKELEKANAEMSSEFSKFYEIVLTNGLLDASPQVLNRLKGVTESFRRFTSSIPDASGYLSPEDDRSSLNKSVHPKKESNSASSDSHSPPTHAAVQSNMPIAGVTELPVSNYAASMHSGQTNVSGSYEVVAQATPENASFPQFASMDPQANQANMMQFMQGSFPFSNLAPPSTYAFQEPSFAKRLSRRTGERAWALAAMAHPPPERFAAVFGFTLLFETREQICERLIARLHNQQALCKQPWKPDHVGPVATEVEQQLRGLFIKFRQGFMYAEEIEQYLIQLGITIPQQTAYVEAAVDMNDLKDTIEQSTGHSSKFSSPNQSFNDAMSKGIHHEEMQSIDQMQPTDHHHAMQGGINRSVASLMFPQDGTMWAAPAWTKPKFTIDVGLLVEEIISGAVCLGHNPGVRVKDVNRAIRIAAGVATA